MRLLRRYDGPLGWARSAITVKLKNGTKISLEFLFVQQAKEFSHLILKAFRETDLSQEKEF